MEHYPFSAALASALSDKRLKEKYFTLNAVKAIANVIPPDGYYLLQNDQFLANHVFRRAGDELDLELSSFLSGEQLDEINCSSKAMLSIRKKDAGRQERDQLMLACSSRLIRNDRQPMTRCQKARIEVITL
jgi:hypothetical protein